MIPDIVSMKLVLANGQEEVETTPAATNTPEAPEIKPETPPLALTDAT